MNFSEFKWLLGAEPLSSDPEVLEARRSGPEFERAAAAAEAFERKLQGALGVGVDEETLLTSLRGIPSQPHILTRAWRSPRRLAMAASVLVVLGIAAVALYRAGQPHTLAEYVEAHFNHDGYRFLAEASETFDRTEVNRIMAQFDTQAGPALVGRVNFIKVCPTPQGEGAHMVISSATGLVTVIYMPHTEVSEPTLLRFDEMEARVIALSTGSAAIIGAGDPDFTGIEALLKASITHPDNGA